MTACTTVKLSPQLHFHSSDVAQHGPRLGLHFHNTDVAQHRPRLGSTSVYYRLKNSVHCFFFLLSHCNLMSDSIQTATRTVLTRRVSSYGLPAWVSSELGPMGGGAQPLQHPQRHWNRVTTKGAFHQSRSNLIWIRIRGQPI